MRGPDGNGNTVTSLLKDTEGKLKASEQEKDNVIGDLSEMTTKYNSLRRKYIDNKTKSKKEMNKKRAEIIIINSKLKFEKEKTSLLPLGKFCRLIFHYISQIIMKIFTPRVR